MAKEKQSDPALPTDWLEINEDEHDLIRSTVELFRETVPGAYSNVGSVCRRFEKLFDAGRLTIWRHKTYRIRIAFHQHRYTKRRPNDVETPLYHLSIGFKLDPSDDDMHNVRQVHATLLDACRFRNNRGFFDGEPANDNLTKRDPNRAYIYMDEFNYKELEAKDPKPPIVGLIHEAENVVGDGKIEEVENPEPSRHGWPDVIKKWKITLP